jgi:hypothetical protein
MRDLRFKRLVAVGVAGMAMFSSAVFAVTSSATASSAATTCAAGDSTWRPWVQGVPQGINLQRAHGVYMWHDGRGWHIRVTHVSDSLRTFSGQLISAGEFRNVTPVALEDGDTLAVSANRHTVSFLFTNYGHVDGLDFTTHCAPRIRFAFQSDGVTVPKGNIAIGHAATHPAGDPFSIASVPAPTTTAGGASS